MPAIRATPESCTFHRDGCELFFPSLESIIMRPALMLKRSLDAWKMFHKTGAPFKHLLYLSRKMWSQGPTGDELPMHLTQPLYWRLRRRHIPTALKQMHGNTSRSCSVGDTGVLGSLAKWCLRHAKMHELGGSLLLTGLWGGCSVGFTCSSCLRAAAGHPILTQHRWKDRAC